ncbi:MAG: hypothetical protein Q9191_004969 [Dirinaria sp. TL-2023a]
MSLQKLNFSAGQNFVPTNHHDTYPLISPLQSPLPSGFKVFITGASRGIGRATALSYAKAGASAIGIGARSNLSDLEQEIVKAAQDAGRKQVPKVLSVHLDVQEQGSVEKAAREVESQWGSVDVLVNNAGYMAKYEPMPESDPLEWWKTWEISTKFALLRISEFTNIEYGEQGIFAYSLHPGGVNTEMGRVMPQEMQDRNTPELAGDTIAYLTRSRQDWLAGRYVSVHWDMGELFAMKEKILENDLLRMRLVEE